MDVLPSSVKSISLRQRKTKNVKLFCSFSNLPNELIKNHVESIERKLTERINEQTEKLQEEYEFHVELSGSLASTSIEMESNNERSRG